MQHLNLARLAEILSCDYQGLPQPIGRISTDTRSIQPGDLFLALKGERFDGHDFIPQAIAKGAIALIAEQSVNLGVPCFKVPNAYHAYGAIAAAYRKQFSKPLLAITGSYGKTTVRHLVTAILSQQACVLSPVKNFNNEVGVPHTLLELNSNHDMAVLEMGATQTGDIAYLMKIAKPTVAMVNNAGPSHLETMGDVPGVARVKGEMYEHLDGGVAVLNQDDAFYSKWRSVAEKTAKACVTFGTNSPDFSAKNVVQTSAGLQFMLQTPQGEIAIALPLLGQHQLQNALAAAACAMTMGAHLSSVQKGLAVIKPVKQRLTPYQTEQGVCVIDDTYNANPISTRAAIDVLAAHRSPEKVFVFGDMVELGSAAVSAHIEMGRYAKSKGIQTLLTVGALTRHAVKAFGEGAKHFETHDALIEDLQTRLSNHLACLVKGSRAMKMEKVVQALMASEKGITTC